MRWVPVSLSDTCLRSQLPRAYAFRELKPATFRDRLPEPLRQFDTHQIVPDPADPQRPALKGSAHHASHPHLVHEFVRSIAERRPPAIDASTAANWTAAGLCAHASALRDGAAVDIPSFE